MFANKVKKCLGDDRYYALIHNEFKPGKITHHPYHEILCSLPFKGFTTTNYDYVLESALINVTKKPDNSIYIEGLSKVKVYEFLLSLNQSSSYPKRVIHLHGRYDVPASIILCEEEYKTKYGFAIKTPSTSLFDQIKIGSLTKEEFETLLLNYGYEWTLRRKLLWSILATRRVVFIGFSLRDPYFIKMLEFISDDLNPFGFDTHFLILRITQENKDRSFQFAERVKDSYGIETIFFEDDESFKGLEKFILEMGNKILPKTPSQINVDDKSEMGNSTNEELTNKLMLLNKKQIYNEDK